MMQLKAEENILGGPFVAIAGNIGSGKSTLTGKLAEHFKWRPHYESVQENPYLSDFYKNMKSWSFHLQVYFLTHRFETHSKMTLAPTGDIQDRSIYEDAFIFARALFDEGKMSEKDYETYLKLFHLMTNYLTPPSLLIYLRRNVTQLVDRIELRGRDCEKGMDIDYLSRLNDYYEDWFRTYDAGPCIVVESNSFDLLNNEEEFLQLVAKIRKALNLTSQMEIFSESDLIRSKITNSQLGRGHDLFS